MQGAESIAVFQNDAVTRTQMLGTQARQCPIFVTGRERNAPPFSETLRWARRLRIGIGVHVIRNSKKMGAANRRE